MCSDNICISVQLLLAGQTACLSLGNNVAGRVLQCYQRSVAVKFMWRDLWPVAAFEHRRPRCVARGFIHGEFHARRITTYCAFRFASMFIDFTFSTLPPLLCLSRRCHHIIVLLFGRDTGICTTAYKRYIIANEWFILACHVTREQ